MGGHQRLAGSLIAVLDQRSVVSGRQGSIGQTMARGLHRSNSAAMPAAVHTTDDHISENILM